MPDAHPEAFRTREYNVSSIFEQDSYNSLVLLNQTIRPLSVFERIWRNAKHRVCADGAANHLYDDLITASTGSSAAATQDGGAAGMQLDVGDFIPDAIVGDLDSLRHDVRQWYEARGVPIIQDRDQYSTDFAKSLKHVYWLAEKQQQHQHQHQHQHHQHQQHEEQSQDTSQNQHAAPQIHNVIIHGSLGGRVDQGIGVLHELYREARRFVYGAVPLPGAAEAAAKMSSTAAASPSASASITKQTAGTQAGEIGYGVTSDNMFMERRRLWLVSEQSLSLCLPPGSSTLTGVYVRNHTANTGTTAAAAAETQTQRNQQRRDIFAKHCGLLPVFGAVNVEATTGLEWDVEDWRSEMGGRVSSSNHVVCDTVSVRSDGWLLFTVAFDSEFLR